MRRLVVVVGCLSLSSLALATPCPDQQPRLFPGVGDELPAEGRVVLFVRPDLASAVASLEKASLTLDSQGKSIPLKAEKRATPIISALGERVFIYKAARLLQPGRTYKLGHLPKLPPAWASLGKAEWKAVASSRKPPEIDSKKIGRTYCATIATDARVCGIALLGQNKADEPLLFSADLFPTDEKAKAKYPSLVDIVVSGGEFVLRNQVCDSPLSELAGGKYDATFRLTDSAGRTGEPWKAKIEVRDLNEEMSRMPGQNR